MSVSSQHQMSKIGHFTVKKPKIFHLNLFMKYANFAQNRLNENRPLHGVNCLILMGNKKTSYASNTCLWRYYAELFKSHCVPKHLCLMKIAISISLQTIVINLYQTCYLDLQLNSKTGGVK